MMRDVVAAASPGLLAATGKGDGEAPVWVLKWAQGFGGFEIHFVRSASEAASIISAAHASGPHGLTIVTLGPPTNLAAALAKAPEIAPKLRRVLLMGGQLDKGGRMCLNFMSDRAAARAVLAAQVGLQVASAQEATTVEARPLPAGRRPAARMQRLRAARATARGTERTPGRCLGSSQRGRRQCRRKATAAGAYNAHQLLFRAACLRFLAFTLRARAHEPVVPGDTRTSAPR